MTETPTPNRRRHELTSYLCFGLSLSFLPILLLYIVSVQHGRHLALHDVVTDGGVLIIAIVLAANGLSRLMVSSRPWRVWHASAFFAAMAVITLGSMCYVLPHVSAPQDPVFFAGLCCALLVTSVVTTTLITVLADDN